ncbi:ring-opening amidohydrolase [Microlunatus soli]|uniref:Cyanuric acid amidohydrolase n=1 Tax=Microlunatus soli TaxID=630515 RepID=A0A1H1R3I4_9ACTN|nr:ring-opening amidohydrolase [Microlunatus soli]SDS30190.1 cyanuric acid amidohydrolase [Microlunatus soli]
MSEETSLAVDAVRIPMEHPRDTAGLAELVSEGRIDPDKIIAVTGKTISSTSVENSRVDADRAVRAFLVEQGSRSAREIDAIPMIFTAGIAGLLTPQIVVFSRYRADSTADGSGRLAIGTARSAIMRPEWTGGLQVVRAIADTVRGAARDAGIRPSEIEYVVGKAYHPVLEEIQRARERHDIPAVDDATVFRTTSGSAGLGIAVATEGLELSDPAVIGDLDVWTGRSAVSANAWEPVGGDGPHTQLIAFGNRADAAGRLRVGHAVMADLLDVHALPRALRSAGLDVGDGPLTEDQQRRVVSVYAKISGAPRGRLRGRRQVTENPGYDAKTAVGGMLAGWLQDTLIWISASAVQQGPPGGGTLGVIVDVG